ncbi:flagellar hook-length control protein FliK [Roseibium sediminicola]|uniref:Flagellar hook-length control protein FliK n=1 Tax=Roseibium sediminicola TaxID=2933272 RepID=A0ABT0GPC0_9HYPH|nr:flagellar hook-length control protein FliK [Roseibium sp. CAU 1639]MCK7611285.1 flagellar hook-length control protein FliK [Roseibium sp. CAU 1639]
MTVNTSALIPAATKSGKSVDGSTGERSQQSAKDAAAAFQSVLRGMKGEGTPVEGAGDTGAGAQGQNPGQGDADANTAVDQTGGTAEDAAKLPSGTAFSTSNLVDALRQVSHNVMSRVSGGEAGDTVQANGGDAIADGRPGAAATLSLEAVLVPKPGQIAKGLAYQAGAATPSHVMMPARTGQDLTGQEGAGKTGTSSLFAQFGVEPESVSEPLTAGSRRSLLPEEAAGTVKILRQETHFAPNLRLSPAQQVGDELATALKSLASETARAGQGGVTHKAEGPVLKTLDIQLTPHELGTVKVSLRMVGDTVEVTLQTSKAQTAELLRHDRQLLDQMLRATGFKADAITIQVADDRGTVAAGSSANGNSVMNQNNSGNGAFGDGQSQNSGNNASGQHQGRSGERARDEQFQFSEQTRGNGHEEATGNSLSDGLYL